MSYPADVRYTSDHEWIRVSGDTGQIGITDYAQQQLGDVVYVELPDVGRTFEQGEQFGSIESVKAVSDLYCPVSGEVVEVNAALTETPESVNQRPYDAWIITVKLSNADELAALHDAAAYAAMIDEG
jgi:glycine cleavage system H protein